MFNITQIAQVPPGTAAVDFVVTVKGSVMTINGYEYDFAFMSKGDYLPFDAIQPEVGEPPFFFERDIICDDDGVINVAIYVPVQDPSEPLPVLQNKKLGKVIDAHIPAMQLPEEVRGDADQQG